MDPKAYCVEHPLPLIFGRPYSPVAYKSRIMKSELLRNPRINLLELHATREASGGGEKVQILCLHLVSGPFQDKSLLIT